MRSRPGSVLVLVLLCACAGKSDEDGRSSTSISTSASEGGEESGSSSTTGGTSTGSGSSGTGTGTTGTTGSTSTTTSSTGSGDETGTPFVIMPDGGGAAMECDLWTQDCIEGQKCMPWANDGGFSWNASKCSPIAEDPKGPGDECTVTGNDVSGIDDCDKGSMCFSVNPETLMGICVPMCSGTQAAPTCENPEQLCNISNDGVLILCLDQCNPVLQDCAASSQPQGCYPVGDNFLCWPDFSFDNGAYASPCEYFNVCDVGLFCANPTNVPGCTGSSGCCSEYCDLDDPEATTGCSGSAQGQECLPYYDMPPPGLENVGFCGVPT